MFSFSFKKLLFLLAIVVFLLATVVSVVKIIQWQKARVVMETARVAMEARRMKCLENVSKMNEEELIATVESFNYEDVPFVSVREAKKVSAIKQLFRYLVCKIKIGITIKGEKNEALYSMVKEFITRNVSEVNREEMLTFLEDTEKVHEKFNLLLAFADLDKLCPEKLPNLCVEQARLMNMGEKSIENCKYFCDRLNLYSENKDILGKEIINYSNWSDDPAIFEGQYKMRLSVAYRFGGEDLALEICHNMVEPNKESCLERINYLNNIKKGKYCDEYMNNLKNLLCQID